MSWQENPIMEWFDPRTESATFNQWVKISDHGRSPLSITVDRIENSQRMANGRMRRYVVAKKRSFSCSWENIPNRATSMLANGQPGEWMKQFHDDVDGSFLMRIRAGSDIGLPTTDPGIEEVRVLITDFSNDVTKRGPECDLWDMDLTLEEA